MGGIGAIGIAALIILLLFSLCIVDYSARRAKKSADDLCYRANKLSSDIDTMERYLLVLRDRIEDLTKTLRDIDSEK